MSEIASMTDEDLCRIGVCSDCGGPMKVWSTEEINQAKADLGMNEDDDFSSCCKECEILYTDPNSGLAVYRSRAIPLLSKLSKGPEDAMKLLAFQFAYIEVTKRSLFEVMGGN